MLITCKLAKDKRPVVDFRLLNKRISRRNIPTTLINDMPQILGNSKYETLSYIDLKNAFDSFKIYQNITNFVEICPILVVPIFTHGPFDFTVPMDGIYLNFIT